MKACYLLNYKKTFEKPKFFGQNGLKQGSTNDEKAQKQKPKYAENFLKHA